MGARGDNCLEGARKGEVPQVHRQFVIVKAFSVII
jgi:hypothetical protein